MTPHWAAAVTDLWTRVAGGVGELRLAELPEPRTFEVRARDGVLEVAAGDALSACVGIHRYLRDAGGVRVTWGSDPLSLRHLPDASVSGRARVREFYYLNFCTFSYSTAYWGWDEWQREIDWMALHGVTMPLNLVGHEAALALAYGRLGMTDKQILQFLGGPGYLPFLYLGCLDSFAGPLPASWIPRHLDLARQILARQRSFGMTPVLPAFTGHVPAAFGGRTRHWQGMPTTVIDPSDPLFRRLCTSIAQAQAELFGTDHLYAADPFIEMPPDEVDGDAGYPAAVASAIVDGLRAADPDATWVLQSWPFSYQSGYWTKERVFAFLDGIPADRLLILDLWGEADPQWPKLDGYAGRPWVWNGLLNFGGRAEPVADLGSTDRNIEAALASDRPPVGLGLTMEAIHTTPAFFELIADRAWSSTPPLEDWVRDFGRQRYGSSAPAVDQAWRALRVSVLDGHAKAIFPERFISLAITRPHYGLLDSSVDSDVRTALFYRPADLLAACQALLASPPSRAADDDLALACAALLLRVIDNRFGHWDSFLDPFDDLDDLVGTRPTLRLSTWVEAARRWTDDDESERVLEDNARRMLTVWNTTDNERLHDYSARLWSGLVRGYYKRRWELWLRYLPQALEPGGRAPAQSTLDAALDDLATDFIAHGPASEAAPGDVRTVAAGVLDRYGDEFLAL
ncbi:alpha-N-acetylglucosaminidase [Micromonospora sp. CPCC 206061]|uniref:alpha-N-acetylglucosaminidase n=1 Tax=Micromonospora sp. CPCC 206061 TaxID=3122410 RepID=UPI002FEFBE1B